MLQYYLRAEGLALSWVGTGRLIFSLNYTDADFDAVAERFVAAAEKMKRDGWWWRDARSTNKNIKPADPERRCSPSRLRSHGARASRGAVSGRRRCCPCSGRCGGGPV